MTKVETHGPDTLVMSGPLSYTRNMNKNAETLLILKPYMIRACEITPGMICRFGVIRTVETNNNQTSFETVMNQVLRATPEWELEVYGIAE